MADTQPGSSTQQKPRSTKSFLIIFTGQSVSLLGSQLVQFALVWWLTEKTGSATVLALASLVAMVPQILLGPFAGALVDRWNRKKVMILADAIIALTMVVLAVLFSLNVVQIWHIYAVKLVRSAASAFHWPAMQASTTLMVPERHYTRVSGLQTTLQGLTNIVSPPIGAILMTFLPIQMIMAIDVGTAFIAIIPLLFLAIPQPTQQSRSLRERPSVLAEMKEGLDYIWKWRGGLFILLGSMVVNLLFTPAAALTPILVTRYFNLGAKEYAVMGSAFGVGMVLGGLALSLWGGFKKRIVTAMVAAFVAGIATLLNGLLPPSAFLIAVGARFVAAFTLPLANGSMFAILQARVPPEMQGRVFTLLGSGSGAMAPLGLAIGGPVADVLGIQFWYIVGGLGLITIGASAFLIPSVMHLEEESAEQE